MSSQDWAPVVISKKKPPTGTTVKDVDAVRARGKPAGTFRLAVTARRGRSRAHNRRRGELGLRLLQ